MTNDSYLFESSSAPDRLPLLEGKMIHQFDSRRAEPRHWIEEERARRALLGRADDVGQKLGYQAYRLAFRDVASSTNERTMIAAVLPPGSFTGNTLIVSVALAGQALPLVLALLNSFVCDYLVRQRVTTHCNMFYVYQLRVPRLSLTDRRARPLIESASRLTCISSEFAELWQEVMEAPWSPDCGASTPVERAALRAEIDGQVAHLYGLTEEEFAHILSTFPVVPQVVKDEALAAYRALIPKPGDPEIAALLALGESERLELKSTLRWDLKAERRSPEVEKAAVKTVAGFLNAEGGTLLLGVADDGSVLGLEPDFQTLKKRNRDGYSLFLHDLLLRELGKDLAPCLRVTFHQYDGREVCRVLVSPAPRAVFIKEGQDDVLYLRAGNSTRRLSVRDAVEYARTRWKG
jgi:hypothetical protein